VLDNPDWAHRGVLVELVNVANGSVIARDYSTFFDLRSAADATTQAADDLEIEGFSAQLTDFGLGKTQTPGGRSSLEVPHLSSLPRPDLASLNEALVAAAELLYLEEVRGLDACMNLKELDDAFDVNLTTLPAYLTAYLEAFAYYGAYKAWQEGGSKACSTIATSLAPFTLGASVVATLGCELAMATWCVEDVPQPEDFELCVDRLEAEATSLSIGGVSDVDLMFQQTPPNSAGARIQSELTFSRPLGTLDLRLRGLSVRWGADKCTPRPNVGMADSAIPASLSELTTCENVTVSAPSATTLTNPGVFRLDPDTDDERLRVTQADAPRFTLVDEELDVEKGACALDFLREDAEDLAGSFPARFESALSDVWNAGGDRPQQAEALELLLDRLELGIPTDRDYSLLASFEPLLSAPAGGTLFEWETLVTPAPGSLAFRLMKPTWFHHPPPWEHYYAADGLDLFGEEFDLSYTLTTGHLNQILHVRGGTERLHFAYQPTFEELAALGVDPSRTSHPLDVPPPLDGSVLGQIHSVWNELGTTPVTVSVYPTLDPIVWMHPDHPDKDEQGSPLAYGISGLEIRFTAPPTQDPVTGQVTPGFEWMRAVFAFIDDSLAVDFGPHGSKFLRVEFGNDVFGVNVERNAFSTCRPAAHGVLEPPAPCERDLEQRLADMFVPLLRPRFLEMLSDLEAPQYWDAGGTAPAARHVELTSRYQAGQYIHLFANIPSERR
jgi:hypothetical protein